MTIMDSDAIRLEIIQYKAFGSIYRTAGYVEEDSNGIAVYSNIAIKNQLEELEGSCMCIANEDIIYRYEITPFGFGLIYEVKKWAKKIMLQLKASQKKSRA